MAKKLLAGLALASFAGTALAQDDEYHVAVAVTHTASFGIGAPWFLGRGWHEDSGADATAEAVAACQEASGGTQCWGLDLPSLHGGCVAAVLGTWAEQDGTLQHQFFAGTGYGSGPLEARIQAEHKADSNCYYTTQGRNALGPRTVECSLRVSFCSADVGQEGIENGKYVRQSRSRYGEGVTRTSRYQNGVLHGVQIEETKASIGVVIIETPFVRGKIHGVVDQRLPTGNYYRTPYANDVRHGMAQSSISGVLLETPYHDGVPHGLQRFIRRDGTISGTILWRNGQEVERQELPR